MKSLIKTYTYSNGDIQRVQAVRLDSWAELDFQEFSSSDRNPEDHSQAERPIPMGLIVR